MYNEGGIKKELKTYCMKQKKQVNTTPTKLTFFVLSLELKMLKSYRDKACI